jgi:hypothetical protein
MKNFLIIIIGAAVVLSYTAFAASYSTEATITPLMDKGEYKVDVRISRLVEQDGKLVENLISEPRIRSGLGCAASYYQGLQPTNPDYQKQENFSIDVSWPYPNESGVAFCTIVVKQGDKVVSKSRLQLQITGKGRVPLVLSSQNVDPKSVKVEVEKKDSYVLLKFGCKTDEESRKISVENLGNQAEVRDAAGQVVGSGFFPGGAYDGIGLALQCKSEDEARRLANTLVIGSSK